MNVAERLERFRRWITASSVLGSIEPHMFIAAQDLGRIDIELLELDENVRRKRLESPLEADLVENTRRLALSRLWVLGAYELARTVEQRLRHTPGVTHDKSKLSGFSKQTT